MTDKNLTEIICVVDRSGSMETVQDDAIGGFNAFLKEQQKSNEGKCLLTYVQFDSQSIDTVHECKPIEDVPELTAETFVPRGGTPLRKAMCLTIDSAGARFKGMPEEKRPGNVVMVVLTDGHENASGAEFPEEMLKAKVKRQADEYDWTFIYLAQNIDAFAAGHNIGMSQNHPKMFLGNAMKGGAGQQAAYMVASAAVVGTRHRSARGVSTDFCAEEKEAYTSGLLGDDEDMKNLNVSDSSDGSSSTSDSSAE